MLYNIVDNIKQCWQQNIVQCCFQQPWTGSAIFCCDNWIKYVMYTGQKTHKLFRVDENSIEQCAAHAHCSKLSTIIVQYCWSWISPQSGVIMLNNIVDNIEQCGQHNIAQSCFYQPWTGCALLRVYTAKNQKLLKTGCNNVVGATLFNVVNNIVRHCYTWLRANSGSTILFNIVDNQEQCCPNNIVASCFQQPVTTHNFLPCMYVLELGLLHVMSSGWIMQWRWRPGQYKNS